MDACPVLTVGRGLGRERGREELGGGVADVSRTWLKRSPEAANTCINQNHLHVVFSSGLLFPRAPRDADVFLWVSRARLLQNTGHIDHTFCNMRTEYCSAKNKC